MKITRTTVVRVIFCNNIEVAPGGSNFVEQNLFNFYVKEWTG